MVDDDELVRLALENILTKMANFSIEQAKNGKEAIEKVKQRKMDGCCKWFSLIFMDVNMPECDGIEATKEIRKLGYRKGLVGYTAYNHIQDVKECKESRMDQVLNIPS